MIGIEILNRGYGFKKNIKKMAKLSWELLTGMLTPLIKSIFRVTFCKLGFHKWYVLSATTRTITLEENNVGQEANITSRCLYCGLGVVKKYYK